MSPENPQKIKIKADPDLADLIPGFLKNREADVQTILAAAQAGDFNQLKTIGHQMKGSGAGFGFDRISELGAAIEYEAMENRAAKMPGLAEQLADYLKRLEVSFE